ncbi:MAG TPA: ATP-binding protein [Gemmataceae bacterium]
MGVRFGFRWQIVLIAVLFAASLAVLLWSMLVALRLPAREKESRQQLTEASRRMAEEAASLLEDLPATLPREPPPNWERRLTALANRVLEGREGVEGGFYLAGDWDKFTSHAFPNDPHRPADSPRLPLSPDPPPNEKPPVHDQCLASLNDASPIVQVRDIGPSRVLIVTEPVGWRRPARMATWVLTRLTSPEHTAAELVRFQAATGLALAGIVAALVLAVNLGRNLRLAGRQREQLRDELRRAEHLAALGKLLAGVAHEVRNPLAAIRSTAQLWQRLPPEARDPSDMDAIVRGVDRLNDLVSRLLFFARSGHEEHRPVDVNTVVQEALTLLRAQAESQKVTLNTELAADLPAVSGSVQALQQVVLNLATNALQAMPSGGTLLCRTRRLESPPRVELWVADTGPGIAAEELPHLFEPFHTTRPEGTGLGLALCREIVQQHGGRIELDRQDGWGAVFRVTLPSNKKASGRC